MSSFIPHTILKRIGDAAMNAVIDAIERSLNRLEAHPFANMKVIPGVVFTGTFPVSTRVYHGLGYSVSGYLVLNTPNAFGWLAQNTAVAEPDPNNYIVLGYGNAATVTLGIF